MRQPEGVAMLDLSTNTFGGKGKSFVQKTAKLWKAAIGFDKPINTLWTE